MAALYCTTQQVRDMLSGQWSVTDDKASGTSTRESIMTDMITRLSRQFDREVGKPSGFWAAGTVTRYYSGLGGQWLDIDDFQSVTGITMGTAQNRSDLVALTLTDTASNYFVEPYPLLGPPFARLFLLRGWLPDPYAIGNIAVTGVVITPEEIVGAVAEWTAYKWKMRDAGLGDTVQRPGVPGVAYAKGMPDNVARIIAYYKQEERGANVAVVDGSYQAIGDRVSPWLGWRTQ